MIRACMTALLLLPLACSPIKPQAPEVNLLNLSVAEITLSHVNMLADLRFFNPNQRSLTVREIEYTLTLNGTQVSEGRSFKPLTIAAGEYGSTAIRLASAHWNILRFINSVKQGESVRFVMDGFVKVGGVGLLGNTFSFKKEGYFLLDDLKSLP